MSTIRETWIRGAEMLAAAGIDSARLDARVLLAHTMNLATGESVSAREPSADELARYEELLARRAAREPVAYITGEREFWSLPFAVGRGVLVPRPETETLVEEAISGFPDRTQPLEVLDLGTGSGCLLIAFLSEYPNACGVGVDESDAALVWARQNAARNGVAERCDLRQGDWFTTRGRTFDVIFCNPPYLALSEASSLPPEIALYEPPQALFAGVDGLEAYRLLAPVLAAALKPGGWAGLEIGAGQIDCVCPIMRSEGLEITHIAADLSGVPRCVVVRRGAGPVEGPG